MPAITVIKMAINPAIPLNISVIMVMIPSEPNKVFPVVPSVCVHIAGTVAPFVIWVGVGQEGLMTSTAKAFAEIKDHQRQGAGNKLKD